MAHMQQQNEIEIEEYQQLSTSDNYYEQSGTISQSLNSGQIINECSCDSLLGHSHLRSNSSFDSYDIEYQLLKKNNVNINDVILEKLQRISLSTDKKEGYPSIEDTNNAYQDNQMDVENNQYKQLCYQNTESHSQSLRSSSDFQSPLIEWKVNDLVIGEKSKRMKLSKAQNKYDNEQKQYKEQRMQTHPITHILVKEINNNEIFYLIGNVIIDFKSGVYFEQEISPSGKVLIDDVEVSRVVNNALKQIVQIENNYQSGEVTAKLQLNVNPLGQFGFLTQLLKEKANTQISKQMAIYLEHYQQNAAINQRECIQRAIQRAQECNLDFNQLLKQRSQTMNALQKQIVDDYECSNSGFYVLSHFCADFQSLEHNLQQFSYSYPLVALLGFDPNQFANGISKKGLQMWISPYTRSLLLLMLLKDWCQSNIRTSESYVDYIEPFYFRTVDEMVVSCKAKRDRRFVQYTGQLEYIFEGVVDSVTIVNIDIDLFTIKRILGMRKDYVLHQKATQFIDDFEYNIQSQIFLEKYYNDIYQQYVHDQHLIQKSHDKKAIDDTKVCSYKQIRQQPAVVRQGY